MTTNDARHTPGPWKAGEAAYNPPGWLWVQNGPGALLADVHQNKNIALDARNANARLIAAAPDLYAALAEIELVLHPDADEHNPLCQGTHTWDEVIGRIVERARAALAKVQP